MPSSQIQQLLTEDRVQLMINEAIDKYDAIQAKRHNDFMNKMDPIFEWVMKQKGINGFIRWAIPIGVSIIVAAFEIHRSLK